MLFKDFKLTRYILKPKLEVETNFGVGFSSLAHCLIKLLSGVLNAGFNSF